MLVSPPPSIPLPIVETIEGSSDEESDSLSSPIVDVSYHSLTLKFRNKELEGAYAAVVNTGLMRMDSIVYTFTFILVLYGMFCPDPKLGNPWSVPEVQPWRWPIAHLPMLLLVNASSRCRGLYLRHREQLIVFSYITTLHWQLHVEHSMGYVPAELFLKQINMLGYCWLVIMTFLFRLRFRLQLSLNLFCFAVNISLLPKICYTFYPSTPNHMCFSMELLKIMAMVLVLPLMVVWWAERRCRGEFLKRIV